MSGLPPIAWTLKAPRYNLSDFVKPSVNEFNIETKMATALGHALQGSESLFANLSCEIAQQIALQALHAQVEYLPEGNSTMNRA